MIWLQSLDASAFHFLNQSLRLGLLDWVMPFFSGNALFVPALILVAVGLVVKGGPRGRWCVALLLVIVGVANNAACDWLKHLFARPRPFLTLTAVHELVGRGGSYSMPSSHAANWFAATVVAGAYYRRSRWYLLAVAILVGFSRVYVGVHSPGDVLAGAALGTCVGIGGLAVLERLWRWLGQAWFPLWFRQQPSLLDPDRRLDPLAWQPGQPPLRDPAALAARQWLHLGYVLLAVLLLARWGYLAAGKIELSEDEAYQWLWSKHLALSYYSKPPLIAYTQFLGTRLWGDNAFGVRFFAPLLAALGGWLLLRLFAREVNARAGFWLIVVAAATPLLGVGSILMTIDPLSVLFWIAAMVAGWDAVRRDAGWRPWLWVGGWLGLGFLSKYTAVLQLASFGAFFLLWPPARRHLRRPGPYLAIGVGVVLALPVLIWNAQHAWITVHHLHDRAGLAESWHPTARFLLDFTLAEAGLLNPVFFGGMIWAVVMVWRHRRQEPFLLYLLSMGAPLFLGYWLYTLRARVQPNWIAPAVLPLLCLLVAYGDARWRAGVRAVKAWLIAGAAPGLAAVVLLHDTNLIGKITGHGLPPADDPLRRVHGWAQAAEVVAHARHQLLAEGRPVFIIADHYGTAGLLSFYLPEAKAGVPKTPLVFFLSSPQPLNQFYFWPGYQERHGENALFVSQSDHLAPPPAELVHEFRSVTDLGWHPVMYRGKVLRHLQLFACHDLR